MDFKRLFALSCLVVFAAGPDHAETPAKPASAPGTVVSGTATIELKKGTVQCLNGLGIAVIPEDTVADLKKIRNEHWMLLASRSNFNDGFNNLDLNAIGSFAVEHAVTTVKADEKGKFEIKDLKPGFYRLYAQYQSRYAVAYWLVPVKITGKEQQITADINTGNIEEAYNLFH